VGFRRIKIIGGIAALLVVSTTALWAIDREHYAGLWADAEKAVTWHNPLCSPVEAWRGLLTSRTVKRRSEEIRAQLRLIREEQDGLFLYTTPSGPIWMPQAGDLNSLAVVLAEQEAAIYGQPSAGGVRPGDVVLDAGAHAGLFAREALHAGASQVITFEVTPKSNLALRRNLAREIEDGRVLVIEKGVWFEEGTLGLQVIDNCSICNSVSHPWMGSVMEVPLTRIDTVVAELKLPRVDFIKLDVENAEANALRGARDTLARFHPRLAVALENSKTRLAYAHEVLGILHEAHAGYEYSCGAITNADTGERVLPEILHFY
jgi:FkbM family methyltransferase